MGSNQISPQPPPNVSIENATQNGRVTSDADTRLDELTNTVSKLETQVKGLEAKLFPKFATWLGIIGGGLAIIGGLVILPKTIRDTAKTLHPQQSTMTWGKEIEIAYTPRELAFTFDLIASNDGEETDQIDAVSAEIEAQQLPVPVFMTKDDIRMVQTNQATNIALRTPLSLVAKQPKDLRIAAVVTASSDSVLEDSEPKTLRVSITLHGHRTVEHDYCTPALDDDDRKALRAGKPRRALIGTDSRTYAREGDIAEGVKVQEQYGTYVLNLRPEVPSNAQGKHLVVFHKDGVRSYEVKAIKRSCGPSMVGWVRVEEN